MTDATPAVPAPGLPRPRGRRAALLAALLLPVAAAGYIGWLALRTPPPPVVELPEHSLLQLDLSRPDALIESASLTQLPRDLLRVPLLNDLLTEDFLFYYENNADRLGIAGTLRRLAFEHELDWPETLLAEMFDQPGQVALWRGRDGKLKYAALRLERGALAKLLQPLAEAAADDTQLSVAGQRLIDGDPVTVFRLRYNYDRSILFAAHDDQLLVLSSAEMLQSGDSAESPLGRTEAEQFDALLEGDDVFAPRFGLKSRSTTHRLTIAADYLAMGYGRFLPQWTGLRMDMDEQGWHSFVALQSIEPTALQFTPAWQAMPMGASLCAAVPVSKAALQSLLARLDQANAVSSELAQRLDGPAALCWYPKSRLHSPLLVTQLQGTAADGTDEQLEQAFSALIGAYEANAPDGRFAVESKHASEYRLWQRVVGSDWGLHADSELEDAGLITNERFFRVSLARQGNTLLFSLDDSLVEQGLAVLQQRFPPLAEQLPKDGPVPLYLAPDGLAALLEAETLASLPSEVEAVFRNAAETQLLPKLRALGRHQHYALTLPEAAKAGAEWTWLPVSWNAL